MANFVFNIAKGRVAELFNRVDQNDPTNSAIVIVAINATATDATMKDYDTLALLLADANVDEATNSGYARKVLVDSDIAALSPDDSGDLMQVTVADQTWTAVAATGGAWTDLVICYDGDTTGGTDANIIPLTCHDFAVTPNGGDITADVGASGVYQAS